MTDCSALASMLLGSSEMKRVALVLVAACGGSGSTSVDAPVADVEVDASLGMWAPPVTLANPRQIRYTVRR
jgi:hypothetical protein